MKATHQSVNASSLLFGIVHCLGIALLGLYLFDEAGRNQRKGVMGLRMITRRAS